MAQRYCERIGVEKQAVTGEEVFELAQRGDEIAREEVNNFYDYLTQGLFGLQFSYDPEMIVLGGGVSAKEGLLAEINRRMLTHLQTFELKDFVPEIVTCHYQNDANLIGAAANFQAKRIGNYKETADCYSLQSAVSLFICLVISVFFCSNPRLNLLT